MGQNVRSKDKLKKEAENEVTKMFEVILDYAQVACAQQETYKALRSKILRAGNNCIRSIRNRIDLYEVEYVAQAEDIIEICKK